MFKNNNSLILNINNKKENSFNVDEEYNDFKEEDNVLSLKNLCQLIEYC